MHKQKSHKYKHGKRINPLSVSIAVLLALMWLAVVPDYGDESYKAESVDTKAVMIQENQSSIESKIKQHFPKSHVTMIAIAHAESGLNENAKGWNCYYNKNESIVYSTRVKGSHSTACKVPHRKYAWSVDCGVLQLNVKGQVCPNETLDEHLEKVATLSKSQGFNAWEAYKNNSYKKYLTSK